MPSLKAYDWIVINSSGGKDSQTALRRVVQIADEQRYPRSRLVVVHADLGRVEWPGVVELAARQAKHYGLEFEAVARRQDTLLEYVRRRGKWPSATTRFCTSEFKRSPCLRVITRLGRAVQNGNRKIRVRLLNVYGFRAEESPARAKRKVFALNMRASSRVNRHGHRIRTVDDWLPIHDWTEQQVWRDIHDSGVPYHPAYDLGMPRLSCCFCIFAPRAALLIAGKAQPALLQEYVNVEQAIGHDFQHKKPIREIQEALVRGEQPGPVDGTWNM